MSHLLKDIKNFINGLVYGMTLIVPGVSATILAIIIGFYEELIKTINHFSEDYRKNFRYLFVFVLGIGFGAVVFSFIILILMEKFSFPTMLFFIGLLSGIIPLVASKTVKKITQINKRLPAPREILLTIFSMTALIVLSRVVNATTLNPSETIRNMSASMVFFIFLAGIVNGTTLVIPGLSGSMLLLIMGLYPLVIYSISSIGFFLGDITNLSLLRDIFLVMLPYGTGALIGVLCMARLMEKLMRDFYEAVHAVILGLILGSIVTIFLDPMVYNSGISFILIFAGALTFCAGYAISFLLGKKQLPSKAT